MSSVDARLILEITPFLATILIETLSPGVSTKLNHQFERISVGEVVENAEIEDIENAATLSFHFVQCMRYYDFAIVAAFIVFVTKSLDPLINTEYTAIAGVISICAVFALWVLTQRYFENVTANKYVNLGRVSTNRYPQIGLHWGEIGVIVANIVPIASILIIEFIN